MELGSVVVESNGKFYVPEEAIRLFIKAFSVKKCQFLSYHLGIGIFV